jgi:hypothetical protein
MTYAFARIGAVVSMRVEYFANGKRWWVRLHEKGGKRHEMPAHHKLEAFLDEYIRTAGIRRRKDPPFPLSDRPHRRARGHGNAPGRRLAHDPAPGRRARHEGQDRLHTFRATGITAYLEAGGTLENAQAMAAHESPRTTKLYDRTGDEITLDEVERRQPRRPLTGVLRSLLGQALQQSRISPHLLNRALNRDRYNNLCDVASEHLANAQTPQKTESCLSARP